MKKLMLIILLAIILLAGCQRGDFKASLVIEGQPAPFSGWNFGPDSYVLEGDAVKVSGGLVWAEWIDPNEWSE